VSAKRSTAWLIVAVLSVSGSVAGVGLCDYRAPTTDLSHVNLALYYDYLDTPEAGSADVSIGRLTLGLGRIHDEPDLGYSLGSANEFLFTRLRLTELSGDSFLTARSYPRTGEPAYVFGELRATYSTERLAPSAQLRAGIGYGRLTDVTPLAKALRIEETLREDRTIDAGLPDGVLLDIASVIGREREYGTLAAWVGAVESLIEGAAGVALNARALLAIVEEIVADGAEMHCGWTVRFGIARELLRRVDAEREILFSLSTDVARSLNLDSQVEAYADLSGPIERAKATAASFGFSYSRRLSTAASVVAEYALKRFETDASVVTTSEAFDVRLLVEIGRLDLSADLSLSRGAPELQWSERLLVSARVDLI